MKLAKNYENLEILHEGTMPYRAYYIPYACEKDALTLTRCSSSRLVSLDGEWSFGYYQNPEAVPEKAVSTEFQPQAEGYAAMPVPSNWQMFGYGQHQYVNHLFPIPYDPPYVPYENPTGVYVRDFELGADISDMNQYLTLEGVDSCYFVYINGKYVGYGQVSHAANEFDVTDFVHEGTNRIAVIVLKYCDGTYLEDQDKERLSGIFRSVYILARPKSHLRDFTVKTPLSEDYTSAKVEVSGEFIGDTAVALKLMAPCGKVVAEGEISAAQNSAVLNVDDAVLWNAESPNLYTLVLASDNEVIVQKVGLREICRKGDIIYLNGKRIKFKGVNRHDTDPFHGYAVTVEDMEKDLRLMKEANVNAIRTSHYPNSPLFIEMCDKYGFYVISESDIEGHGCGDLFCAREEGVRNALADDPRWTESFLDRTYKNVIRDKNSASVVVWSLGNETGYGGNCEICADWISKYDATRLIHYTEATHCNIYERPAVHKPEDIIPDFMDFEHKSSHPDRSKMDFFSIMYSDYTMIENYLTANYEAMSQKGHQVPVLEDMQHLPFFLSEYAHAMGNSPGDLEGYYDLMYRYDNFVGQFVWEWSDHSIYAGKNLQGRDMFLYGGDFGEHPHNSNFCMDGLVYPDRTPSTGYYELKNVARPVRLKKHDFEKGEYTFQNMLDFTDLNDLCDIAYEIRQDGVTIASGMVTDVHCAPHEFVTVSIADKVPVTPRTSILFRYIQKSEMAFTSAGYILGFDQAVMECAASVEKCCGGEAPAVEELDDEIIITGNRFRYVFRKHLGTFESLVNNNISYITQPMEYNIWRAPIDNERHERVAWEKVGYDKIIIKVYETGVSVDDGCVVIKAKLSIGSKSMQRIMAVDANYTVTPDGQIKIFLDANKTPILPFLPRFGLRLMMPKAFENVEYYGYGPYESYIDKHHATYLDKFVSTVTEQHEDYIKPQENGSHYGCEYVKVSSPACSITAKSDISLCFNASHYTQEELTRKMHNFELEESGMTVLCLDAAQSGIGSSSCGPYLYEHLRVQGGNLKLGMTLKLGD